MSKLNRLYGVSVNQVILLCCQLLHSCSIRKKKNFNPCNSTSLSFSCDSHDHCCFLTHDGFKPFDNSMSRSLMNRSSGFLCCAVSCLWNFKISFEPIYFYYCTLQVIQLTDITPFFICFEDRK